MDPPTAPISGWETITEANASEIARNIPSITNGVVYTYFSSSAGCENSDGTFRDLTRGYTHWASGKISPVEVNYLNPQYSHVRSNMKPSMKPGTYCVWILLEKVGRFIAIKCVTCECAAG